LRVVSSQRFRCSLSAFSFSRSDILSRLRVGPVFWDFPPVRGNKATSLDHLL
jgi:hypothetical protein